MLRVVRHAEIVTVLGSSGKAFHRRVTHPLFIGDVMNSGTKIGLATTCVALWHHLLMRVDILVGVRGEPLWVQALLLRHQVDLCMLLLRRMVVHVLKRRRMLDHAAH